MEEDDYFGWADAPDADDIPTLDDDFTTFDDMAPPKTDESQISKLPDDMGMESPSSNSGGVSSMNMLLKAAGWHPFLHFFVRISNMMYGNFPEQKRPNILASRHRKMFWYSWVCDQIVQWACVVGVLVFAGIAAWKALT